MIILKESCGDVNENLAKFLRYNQGLSDWRFNCTAGGVYTTYIAHNDVQSLIICHPLIIPEARYDKAWQHSEFN